MALASREGRVFRRANSLLSGTLPKFLFGSSRSLTAGVSRLSEPQETGIPKIVSCRANRRLGVLDAFIAAAS